MKHSINEPFLLGLIDLSFSHVGVNLPTGKRSIFGYFVDLQQCEFIPWSELLPSIQTLIQKGKKNYKNHTLTSLKCWDYFRYKNSYLSNFGD